MTAFLTDDVVSLRPLARADLAQLAAWRNDPELRARTRELRPLTEEDQVRWFTRITAPDTRDFMFGVVRLATGTRCANQGGQWGSPRHAFVSVDDDLCDCRAMSLPAHYAIPSVLDRLIGVVGLCHWVPRDGVAEVSFYIGPPEMRGRGYARRALQLLHGWGFDELGLDRTYAETYAFNEASLRLLKRLGYRIEGVLREHVWRQGRRIDSVILGLLRKEWDEQREQIEMSSAARAANAATSGPPPTSGA